MIIQGCMASKAINIDDLHKAPLCKLLGGLMLNHWLNYVNRNAKCMCSEILIGLTAYARRPMHSHCTANDHERQTHNYRGRQFPDGYDLCFVAFRTALDGNSPFIAEALIIILAILITTKILA